MISSNQYFNTTFLAADDSIIQQFLDNQIGPWSRSSGRIISSMDIIRFRKNNKSQNKAKRILTQTSKKPNLPVIVDSSPRAIITRLPTKRLKDLRLQTEDKLKDQCERRCNSEYEFNKLDREKVYNNLKKQKKACVTLESIINRKNIKNEKGQGSILKNIIRHRQSFASQIQNKRDYVSTNLRIKPKWLFSIAPHKYYKY